MIYILQIFLRHLRQSNIQLQNVSNDKKGEDQVRQAYYQLATQYLIPCLDIPYRNRTIFPVRTEEDSIFISLAAYREHLLYDTLKGAFGNAKNPNQIYVGIVMQNCFGIDDIVTNHTYQCYTGVQVVGTDEKSGRPITKVSETTPDLNGVLQFCSDPLYQTYCQKGHIRLLSVHESESLGPAIARYFASKLWGGETYFIQVDSHLEFTNEWDALYINELKVTSNYPLSVLSMYPPGFGHVAGETPGTRLCTCEFSKSDVEDHIIRINNGASYQSNHVYEKPTQIPFIAAGFFMARSEFLKDVPFDPFLPWCFMGEEIALSMRAWTHGWNIYAPRKNWIAHQYRPGRLGLPKFWETVGRVFHRGIGISNRLQSQVVHRVKYMIGYPEVTQESLRQDGIDDILQDINYYGLGEVRSRDDYIKLTQIDFEHYRCQPMHWCNNGELT
jgi:[Skp1-protein]-hydroxyproline N-acetylglucosaminyltransferase